MLIIASSRLILSSSPLDIERPPMDPTPTLSRPRSSPALMPRAPIAAAAEGLSKFSGGLPWCPIRVAEFAGDFLNCCGDDLGPWGEKAACAWETEKGVDTGGVAPRIPDGVRPWLWPA